MARELCKGDGSQILKLGGQSNYISWMESSGRERVENCGNIKLGSAFPYHGANDNIMEANALCRLKVGKINAMYSSSAPPRGDAIGHKAVASIKQAQRPASSVADMETNYTPDQLLIPHTPLSFQQLIGLSNLNILTRSSLQQQQQADHMASSVSASSSYDHRMEIFASPDAASASAARKLAPAPWAAAAQDLSMEEKEILYRTAAMQPIDMNSDSDNTLLVGEPKPRRNARISKDPQSVAARHRRQRISDKMRVLQRLVPGGKKMDTASMLEEAAHYLRFLKAEVEKMEAIEELIKVATGGQFNYKHSYTGHSPPPSINLVPSKGPQPASNSRYTLTNHYAQPPLYS